MINRSPNASHSVLYDELFHFATKIFKGTEIVASDVIHDIFINIWKTESLKFDDINNIKAYIYVSIKNNFKYGGTQNLDSSLR